MKRIALIAVLLVALPCSASDFSELLGLVAMPLAVAAVSEVTGVPVDDLSHLVATLNRASVPPTQVVQVIRYAPVALVVESEQPFLQFVDAEVDRGIIGTQLVTSIDQRLRTYDLQPNLVALREPATTLVVTGDYIPPLVRTRAAKKRDHPHGGPPGQIKKRIGVQTGAEVVHGTRPVNRVVERGPKIKEPKVNEPKDRGPKVKEPKESGRGKGKGKG